MLALTDSFSPQSHLPCWGLSPARLTLANERGPHAWSLISHPGWRRGIATWVSVWPHTHGWPSSWSNTRPCWRCCSPSILHRTACAMTNCSARLQHTILPCGGTHSRRMCTCGALHATTPPPALWTAAPAQTSPFVTELTSPPTSAPQSLPPPRPLPPSGQPPPQLAGRSAGTSTSVVVHEETSAITHTRAGRQAAWVPTPEVAAPSDPPEPS